MNIDILTVGALQTNCYLISKDNKCLIIDPGAEENFIVSKILEEKLIPVGIIVTHNHEDHNSAVSHLEEMYGIKAYDFNSLFEQKHFLEPFSFQVIYTPGHTPDSITIYFYDYGCMFTGDFLFKKDIGRTDLLGGSAKDMLESLNKIKKFDEDIKIYPGHGNTTILGYEKKYNEYLK